MGNASLIVKATRLCNLRCAYCHDWAAGPGNTMRFPVLLAMTKAALEDPTHDYVDFIWHGGETTILPIDFYRRAVFIQQRFRRPGQFVRNVIQTNATRLTDEWANFFKAYNFQIGVSIDGPAEIHDKHRVHASGRPSFAEVMEGVALLRRHQVQFTALMVIGDEALDAGPRAIFETFLELGIKDYGLIEVKPDNQPDAPPNTPVRHYVEPGRMGPFLASLYDLWRAHGDDTISIREIRAIESRLRGGSPGICKLAGSCLGRYYLIEPSGEVAHCDLFKGDEAYTLGHIEKNSFAEIRSSAQMVELLQRNEKELNAMRSCSDFGVCQGWCPHERYLSTRHNPDHQSGCCGLRPLISHIRGVLERDSEVSLPAPIT